MTHDHSSYYSAAACIGLAVIAWLALNGLVPLPFSLVNLPASWLGALVFVLVLALVAWAIATITKASSNVPTNRPHHP